jgi:hypothetical protein
MQLISEMNVGKYEHWCWINNSNQVHEFDCNEVTLIPLLFCELIIVPRYYETV